MPNMINGIIYSPEVNKHNGKVKLTTEPIITQSDVTNLCQGSEGDTNNPQEPERRSLTQKNGSHSPKSQHEPRFESFAFVCGGKDYASKEGHDNKH